MQLKLRSHINKNLPYLKKKKLLIAVSGGIDSIVLSHLMKRLKYDIGLAHCNFGLRGKESNKDERFVISLGAQIATQVHTIQFETSQYAEDQGISTQMAARELRYNWFQTLCKEYNYDYILTAHHKEDILETLIINLTRGTGIDGFTGIPELNGNIARPMLPFTRNDIIVNAARNKFTWREDSSNSSIKYIRNKVRHKIVPVLKELNPGLLGSFDKTLENLKGSRQIIDDYISQLRNELCKKKGKELHFDVLKLNTLSNPKAYLFELMREYGFSEYDDVVQLLSAQTGKQVFSTSHRLLKNRDTLILTNLADQKKEGSYKLKEGILKLKHPVNLRMKYLDFDESDNTKGFYNSKNRHTIFVDVTKLKFPMKLRKWQEGDSFYPFGMDGKKKLSKFFKDEKMSLVEKEDTWLLCSGKQIVWVVGRRMDDRFKLSSNSTEVLRIKLKLEN